MKNKKALALIVSLVLIVGVVLPGTLALSADQDSTGGEFTVQQEPQPETPADPETPAAPETPVIPETPASENPAPVSENPVSENPAPEPPVPETPAAPPAQEAQQPQPPAQEPEQKECTCGAAEGQPHAEDCPLYTAPEPQAECTCGAAEGEPHKNTCPCFIHLYTCPGKDACEDENCLCPCHLFDRIMKCGTLEEIELIFMQTPKEDLNLLDDEQIAQIEVYMQALMPAPLPAIVIEESDPPVESEIDRPTVNYAYVAPFGAPVTGGNY